MVVILAAGIELCITHRADGSALHVLLDGQLRIAGAAQYRFLVPFILRPHFNRMIGQRDVAIFAGVVSGTAFHLDGNDVSGAVIMPAACLGTETNAAHMSKICGHSGRSATRRAQAG